MGQTFFLEGCWCFLVYAFLVQAVDRDFNINRLERYLTISYSSKVSPIIILTKTDLRNEQEIAEIIDSINQRIKNVPVILVSNETQDGYETLKKLTEKGKTYCMLVLRELENQS